MSGKIFVPLSEYQSLKKKREDDLLEPKNVFQSPGTKK